MTTKEEFDRRYEERKQACIDEAQRRANSSGAAQMVYYAYSAFCIRRADAFGAFAGAQVAIVQPINPNYSPEAVAAAQQFYAASPDVAPERPVMLDDHPVVLFTEATNAE